jgi:hypothetical protein
MSTSEQNYRENQEMEEDGEEMEEDESDESDEAEDDEESTKDKNQSTPRIYLPDQPLDDGEELVMDDQAYLVYHQVNFLS